MASFLTRLLGGSSSTGSNRQLAELQLRLIVSLALADGVLHDDELEQIADFIDRAAGSSDREHARLSELAEELIDAPPDVNDLLDEVAKHADRSSLGERIVDELEHIAHADHRLDMREAFLIDLVRDLFDLHDDDMAAYDDLISTVHGYAAPAGTRRAA